MVLVPGSHWVAAIRPLAVGSAKPATSAALSWYTTMVPGSVTNTVVAPGTARRSKPSTRSWVLLMPTAPQRKAAVSPSTATTAATQYPAVDGRFLAGSDGMGGRVGGGRSSVIEEVMSSPP